MKPVYVVSGMQRSGTSMMMVALDKGGMEAVWDRKRDDNVAERFADDAYHPNLSGLHELDSKEYRKPNFPEGYEGKLIKALQMGPGRMQVMPGGIKVVWMWREPEEIRQSYQAFFGKCPWTREKIQELQRRSQDAILNRRDSQMHIVHYRNLVENPRPEFERITNFLKCDLDIDAMVAHIDPSQVRFKEEELVEGIV